MMLIKGTPPDALMRRIGRVQKIDAAFHRYINGKRAQIRGAVQQAIAGREATIAHMTDEILQLRNL